MKNERLKIVLSIKKSKNKNSNMKSHLKYQKNLKQSLFKNANLVF